MSRLRKKLGPEGRCIVTVRGIGYRFEPERAEPAGPAAFAGAASVVIESLGRSREFREARLITAGSQIAEVDSHEAGGHPGAGVLGGRPTGLRLARPAREDQSIDSARQCSTDSRAR